MAREIPRGSQFWPEQATGLEVRDVIKMYEQGFAGVWQDNEARDQFHDDIVSSGGIVYGEDIAHASGFAESGTGKLSMPFVFALIHFPGCLPGAGQDRGDCHVAGTSVFGERTKNIEDVRIGDRVWTGEGFLTEVISTRSIEVKRPIVRIKPVGSLPIECTPDHKMLVYRMGTVGSSRVNSGTYDRANTLSKVRRDEVIDIYENREAMMVRADELTNNDCLLSPISIDVIPRPSYSPANLLDSVMGRFIFGYFLGNGHSPKATAKKKEYVDIVGPDESLMREMDEHCNAIGIETSAIYFANGAWRIRLRGRCISEWFREQCYERGNKSAPGWCTSSNSVIDGLIAADGHASGNKNTFDSTSKSLIWSVYFNQIGRGYEPIVSQVVRSKGTYDNAKPLYRVIWRDDKKKKYVWRDNDYVCRPIRSVERIEGSHIVYDIGVEHEMHSFIANGMATSNCVSHDQKNANMISYACEIQDAKPDEITGKVETAPKIPLRGLKDGAFSTEVYYWFRGYDGDGWSCDAASSVAMKSAGLVTRDNHPAIGVDLTTYSGSKAGKYGRRSPSGSVAAALDDNLIRQATTCKTREARRDFMANGYAMSSCGSEAWSSKRDTNGVSKRQGGWNHALCLCGFDDRESTKSLYGDSLELVQNSWAIWNGGGRDIRDSSGYVPELVAIVATVHGLSSDAALAWLHQNEIVNSKTGNIMIPHGSFWARSRELSRRRVIAKSSVNGWPKRAVSLGVVGNV